jgi:hypothetical protein
MKFIRTARLGLPLVVLLSGGVHVAAATTEQQNHGGGGSGECGALYNYITGSAGSYSYAHAGTGATIPSGWQEYAHLHNRKNYNETDLYAGLAETFSLHDRCDD